MRKYISAFLGASLFAFALTGCGVNGNNVDTYNDGDVRILDQQKQENDRGLYQRNTNDVENRNNNIKNNRNRKNNGGQECDENNRHAGKNGTYFGEGSIGERNIHCGNGTNAGPSGQGGLG